MTAALASVQRRDAACRPVRRGRSARTPPQGHPELGGAVLRRPHRAREGRGPARVGCRRQELPRLLRWHRHDDLAATRSASSSTPCASRPARWSTPRRCTSSAPMIELAEKLAGLSAPIAATPRCSSRRRGPRRSRRRCSRRRRTGAATRSSRCGTSTTVVRSGRWRSRPTAWSPTSLVAACTCRTCKAATG